MYNNKSSSLMPVLIALSLFVVVSGCSSVQPKYTGNNYSLTVHTSEGEPLFKIHANKYEITEVHHGSLVINEKFVRAVIRTSIKHHQEQENNQWYDVGTLTIDPSCKDGNEAYAQPSSMTASVMLSTTCTPELAALKPTIVDFNIRLSDGYGIPRLPYGMTMKLERK
jgi:hypothetical protein